MTLVNEPADAPHELPAARSPGIRVVLDTNIMQKGGPELRGGSWPLLLNAASVGHFRLCVPEVVLRELAAHHRSDMVAAKKMIDDARRALSRLGAELLMPREVTDLEIDHAVTLFDERLRSMLMTRGEVLPLPEIDHLSLVEAILTRRKPFSESERGYRDALIWHSVLEAAATGPVVFVTNNHKDFFAPDRLRLADDLVADMAHAGIDPQHIRPILDLEPLITEVLSEDGSGTAAFMTYIQSPIGACELAEMVANYYEDSWHVQIGPITRFPPWLHYPGVDRVSSAWVAEAKAWRLAGNSYLVRGQIEGLATVGGFVAERLLDAIDFTQWSVTGRIDEDHHFVENSETQSIRASFAVEFVPSGLRPTQSHTSRF